MAPYLLTYPRANAHCPRHSTPFQTSSRLGNPNRYSFQHSVSLAFGARNADHLSPNSSPLQFNSFISYLELAALQWHPPASPSDVRNADNSSPKISPPQHFISNFSSFNSHLERTALQWRPPAAAFDVLNADNWSPNTPSPLNFLLKIQFIHFTFKAGSTAVTSPRHCFWC